jgi:hypothetical protein
MNITLINTAPFHLIIDKIISELFAAQEIYILLKYLCSPTDALIY